MKQPATGTDAADLTLFRHVVARPGDELDLTRAALLIAEAEYPGLDIPRYVAALDEIGRKARTRVARGAAAATPPMAPIVKLVYEELGFQGNRDDYYDPRNSFLNEVLDRRTGIPITLALVLCEVSRRAGVAARGISFPGHFLIRAPAGRADDDGEMIIDPFDGRMLSAADLEELYRRATGDEGDMDVRLLEPASNAQVVFRILNNLRGIYQERGDRTRLRFVLERMAVLAPGAEIKKALDDVEKMPLHPNRSLN